MNMFSPAIGLTANVTKKDKQNIGTMLLEKLPYTNI
jgi:hypothetical protein